MIRHKALKVWLLQRALNNSHVLYAGVWKQWFQDPTHALSHFFKEIYDSWSFFNLQPSSGLMFLSKICTRIGSQHTRRNLLRHPSNSGIQSSQSILMKSGRQSTLFAMHLVSRIFYGGFIQKLFLSTKEIIHLLFAIIVQNQNQQFISFLNVKELFTSLN
jgi:hypothetical protein